MNLLEKYRELETERIILQKDLQTQREGLKKSSVNHENYKKAQVVLQHIAQQTQNNLKVHLDTLVTLALSCLWDIEFDVAFEVKRNKTECVLSFKDKKGNLMDPVGSSGGGPLDVSSFALRCVFLQLQGNRKLLLLDEPFKFIDRDAIPEAAEMLKLVSTQLKLQVIMISHIPEFIDIADHKFKATKTGEICSIEAI